MINDKLIGKQLVFKLNLKKKIISCRRNNPSSITNLHKDFATFYKNRVEGLKIPCELKAKNTNLNRTKCGQNSIFHTAL